MSFKILLEDLLAIFNLKKLSKFVIKDNFTCIMWINVNIIVRVNSKFHSFIT
jgi:hypothetical protein